VGAEENKKGGGEKGGRKLKKFVVGEGGSEGKLGKGILQEGGKSKSKKGDREPTIELGLKRFEGSGEFYFFGCPKRAKRKGKNKRKEKKATLKSNGGGN